MWLGGLNVQSPFHRKLFGSATSTAHTLLRVIFQPFTGPPTGKRSPYPPPPPSPTRQNLNNCPTLARYSLSRSLHYLRHPLRPARQRGSMRQLRPQRERSAQPPPVHSGSAGYSCLHTAVHTSPTLDSSTSRVVEHLPFANFFQHAVWLSQVAICTLSLSLPADGGINWRNWRN